MERQKKSAQGNVPPLAIYPEGGTTNGEYLLQFKKGAFYGLQSIQPFCMRYQTPVVQANALNLNIFAHFVFLMAYPYCILTIKEYPVFKPNAYFFQKW